MKSKNIGEICENTVTIEIHCKKSKIISKKRYEQIKHIMNKSNFKRYTKNVFQQIN